MIAVVQRVMRASVTVDGAIVGEIGEGLCVLAAIEKGDGDSEIGWMAEKLVRLRIFRNRPEDKYFDLDVTQVGGSILLVSNFTVAAETAKGRRPSLSGAADPDTGRTLFEQLVERVESLGVRVATGRFQAEMQVTIENDGPVTMIVSTPPRDVVQD